MQQSWATLSCNCLTWQVAQLLTSRATNLPNRNYLCSSVISRSIPELWLASCLFTCCFRIVNIRPSGKYCYLLKVNLYSPCLASCNPLACPRTSLLHVHEVLFCFLTFTCRLGCSAEPISKALLIIMSSSVSLEPCLFGHCLRMEIWQLPRLTFIYYYYQHFCLLSIGSESRFSVTLECVLLGHENWVTSVQWQPPVYISKLICYYYCCFCNLIAVVVVVVAAAAAAAG